MECVDGVCRFVPKSQRDKAAAAANDENAPPALPPVKVGDVPPMPLPLEPLVEGQGPAPTTVGQLAAEGKVVVLDLWSTKCVRCPEALAKMDAFAAAQAGAVAAGKLVVAAVNIDDKEKGAAIAKENGWAHMALLFIAEATKEMLKARFGLASVPFVMVFDQEGRLTQMGNPKQVDMDAVVAMLGAGDSSSSSSSSEKQEEAAAPAPAAPAAQTFTLDEDF